MLERWRRRRRQREMLRRLEELDRLDQELGLGAWPADAPPRRSRRTAVRAAVAAVLFFGSAVAVDRWESYQDSQHAFAFLNTDPITGEPVRWPSCQPISYQVNPDGAPAGWQDLVATGTARISDATGLAFRDEGITADRNFADRDLTQPVLIMWADEEEAPRLEGNVVGVAGPSWTTTRDGRKSPYRSGTVVLDKEAIADMTVRSPEQAQAVVDHELGHLVGLDHVPQLDQLMAAENSRVTRFQAGDLAGLERLGGGPCR